MISSQRGWIAANEEYVISARKECFKSDRLMIVRREDSVEENRDATGVMSVVYVEDTAGGAVRGTRSVKRAYSS